MGSILFLAVIVAVTAAILGSIGFNLFSPDNQPSPFLDLEKKCEKIALEGYKMHLKYPDASPEEMQVDDMNSLLLLDEMWINDCVNRLPAATVFDIIQKVELDFNSGE